MTMSIHSLEKNYNYDLSPEPKTEPTPLIPSELPDQKANHQLIKDLIRYLRNDDWIEAQNLYLNIPQEEREEMEKLIFNRVMKINPNDPIEPNEIESVINEGFETLICSNCENQDIALNFFIKLFIPSVSDYMVETYEFEKNEAITEIAEEAIKATREHIIVSPNFTKRDAILSDHVSSQHSTNLQGDYVAWTDKLQDHLDSFRALQKIFILKQPKLDPFLIVIYSAQMLEDFHLGNCGEMSKYAFRFLNDKVKRIERGYIKNGDHHFDIINRSKNSKRSDFITWGPRCKVFDTWSNGPNLYPAHDIPLYLKDFVDLDADKNPILYPFNEITQNPDGSPQSVELGVSKIYSTSDLNELFNETTEDSKAIKWFKNQLKKFEDSSSKVQKSIIANEIISKAPKLQDDLNKKTAKTLISQLKSYLNPAYAELYNVGPKNNRPVFECHPCESLFENYLCSTTVDHLLKIALLYQKGEIDKADKKFEKLTYEMKRELYDQFSKSSQNLFFDGEFESLHSRAQVIYVYLIDKMITAKANQKLEVADKIFNKFPEYLQKYIQGKNDDVH